QATVGRCSPDGALIAWSGQPSMLRTMAQEWYALPHRRCLLRDIATELLVTRRELRPFFAEVRATWLALLQHGEPDSRRRLTERLNIANYTARSLGNGQIEIAFQWPDDIQQRFEETQQRNNWQTQVMMLPFQCRERLESGTHLTDAELLIFWDTLQQ